MQYYIVSDEYDKIMKYPTINNWLYEKQDKYCVFVTLYNYHLDKLVTLHLLFLFLLQVFHYNIWSLNFEQSNKTRFVKLVFKNYLLRQNKFPKLQICYDISLIVLAIN